jgi:hypothetical protein
MLSQTKIALSVMIVLGTASGAFAASTRDAHDGSLNGPFFYVDTYGVPPAALHQAQQTHRPIRHVRIGGNGPPI